MAFATADELEAGWKPLSDSEKELAAVLLADAAFWLKAWLLRFGDLEALAAANPLLAEGLKILSRAMVKRAMISMAQGQDGASSVQQSMGPFAMQVAYKNPDGNLYMTCSERDTLEGLLGGNLSGAVSMTASGL